MYCTAIGEGGSPMLGNTRVWVSRLLKNIEDSNTPLVLFFVSFLIITCVRNFLEVFSDHTEIVLVRFIHYSLFYVVLLAWLSILLSWIGGKPVSKVLRALCFGFVIILFPPLFDLLVTGGSGSNIGYLFPEQYPDLWMTFLTFFGAMRESGVTQGIRVEIGIVMLALFSYLMYASRSITRSAIGTIGSYALIFLCGSIPYALIHALPLVGYEFRYTDLVMIKVLLLMSLPAIIMITLWAHPRISLALLRDIRPLRMTYYLLLVLLGVSFGLSEYPRGLVPMAPDMLLMAASLICAMLFSIITNNIADVKIDRVSNPHRPSLSSRVPAKTYRHAAYASLFLSLILIAPLGFPFLFMTLLFIGAYFIYSMPPFRLKRVFILSKAPIGFNSLVAILLGFSLVQMSARGLVDPAGLPSSFSLLSIIGISLAANVIDLKDVKGDRKGRIATVPVVLGMRRAQYLIAAFFLFLYMGISYVLEGTLLSPVLIFGLIGASFIIRSEFRERPVFLLVILSIIWIIVRFLMT